MRIRQLNPKYFYFWFSEFELKKPATREFLEQFKERISGERVGKGTLRFYIAEKKKWAVHVSQWDLFREMIRQYFGFIPGYPMQQKELFREEK